MQSKPPKQQNIYVYKTDFLEQENGWLRTLSPILVEELLGITDLQ
jgi:hypothetical protein